MKNIINSPLNFSEIPNSIKRYLYIHNDLYRWIKINKTTSEEKIVEVDQNDILVLPFWEDELLSSSDPIINDLVNLEAKLLKIYLEKNPNFWIFVRQTVLEKLKKIRQLLQYQWYDFAIKIWYRPLSVQKKLFEKVYSYFADLHTHLSDSEIYEMTSTMVSDPSMNIPPHSTWWAVDVVLLDEHNKIVDMGCPVNFIWEKANWTSNSITHRQQKNREILCDAFYSQWFSSLASEWWHFSYWDPYWAKFYWRDEALYSSIDL